MKKYFVNFAISLIVINLFMFVPLSYSLAQTNRNNTTSSTGQPRSVQDGLNSIENAFPPTVVNKSGSLEGVVKTVIEYALYIAGILCVLFIILGGYQYITSAGSDDKAKSGRKTLTNALIGLAITVLAFVLVQIVYTFLTRPS